MNPKNYFLFEAKKKKWAGAMVTQPSLSLLFFFIKTHVENAEAFGTKRICEYGRIGTKWYPKKKGVQLVYRYLRFTLMRNLTVSESAESRLTKTRLNARNYSMVTVSKGSEAFKLKQSKIFTITKGLLSLSIAYCSISTHKYTCWTSLPLFFCFSKNKLFMDLFQILFSLQAWGR